MIISIVKSWIQNASFWRYGGASLFFAAAVLISVADYRSSFPPASPPITPTACRQSVLDLAEKNAKNQSKLFHVKQLVEKGDTFASLLECKGFSSQDSHNAISVLKPVFTPKELKIGMDLHFTFLEKNLTGGGIQKDFISLTFRPSLDERIILTRKTNGDFQAKTEKIPLTLVKKAIKGTITDSLYQNATQLGVPPAVLHAMFQGFSYDVDFQRSLHPGDQFSLLYEQHVDPESGMGTGGTLITASLVLQKKDLKIYRFQTKNGPWNFYNDHGDSVKKGLLRTPIDGARISSGFGKRHHPILGYTKHHKGVDFAAPPGTPIMASGDGVVEKLGFWDAYGNYIRIRHNREIATAYAHLSRYAKGLKAGKRVAQGQIIGYVGSTGRATGPHLHYELIKGGVQINPSVLKMMPTLRLAGSDLARFKITKAQIDRDFLKSLTGPSGAAPGKTNTAQTPKA